MEDAGHRVRVVTVDAHDEPARIGIGCRPQLSQLLVGDTQHLTQVVAASIEDGAQPVRLSLLVQVVVEGDRLDVAAGRQERRCPPDGGELQRPANAVRQGLAVRVRVVGHRPAVPGLDEDDGILRAEGGAGQAQDARGRGLECLLGGDTPGALGAGVVNLVEDHQRPEAGLCGERLEHRGLGEQGVICENRSCPALEQGLCGPPSCRGEGHDGSTAGARARLDPLLDEACRWHDDENAVNDPLLKQAGGALQSEAGLPGAGARLDEDGPGSAEHRSPLRAPATGATAPC